MKKNVGISYKAFAVILAAVLVLGGTIGGTMAWLIDDTTPVSNVFTDSDINIELTETKDLDLKMIPGYTITKDPKVTVNAGSEDCYLFVKVEKSENYSEYLADYVMNDGADWKPLDGVSDVYYKEVASSDKDQEFVVLEGNKVTVLDTVTKKDMDKIDGINSDGTKDETELKNRPTLTFTAYAVQRNKTNNTPFTPVEAWAKAQGIANNAN